MTYYTEIKKEDAASVLTNGFTDRIDDGLMVGVMLGERMPDAYPDAVRFEIELDALPANVVSIPKNNGDIWHMVRAEFVNKGKITAVDEIDQN